MHKNIILIGFMGSGKTTFGKKLSKILNKKFIDTDLYIEEAENMKITEIFEKKGEDYFRQKETETANMISLKQDLVVATGGGIIKNPSNMEKLKENGIVVYLQSTPENILNNIGKDNSRPLLQGNNKLGKIKTLLEQRLPLYEKYADIKIDVSSKNISQNINAIINKLEEYNENLYN